MLTTEQTWTATATDAPTMYELRLHGGTEDERIVAIPPGKHSIGSGPRCVVRLQSSGVAPMECLLVCDETRLRVRRWSNNTRLNGQSFDEAPLAVGDVLTVGPVELRVMGSAVEELESLLEEAVEYVGEDWKPELKVEVEQADAIDHESVGCESQESTPLCESTIVDEAAHQVLQPTESNTDWHEQPRVELPKTAVEAASVHAAELNHALRPLTAANVRRRSRRALDVLRRQRREHDELISRVNDLERTISEALAQPGDVAQDGAVQVAGLVSDERVTALEGELGTLREQLTTREGELNQARCAIDLLERQRIDSQHTMHEFADERGHWEQQFNEFESRLAEYVERIQELERQLEQAPVATGEESPVPVEAPATQSTEALVFKDVVDEHAAAEEAVQEHVAPEHVVQESPIEEAAFPASTGIDWAAELAALQSDGGPAVTAATVPAASAVASAETWQEQVAGETPTVARESAVETVVEPDVETAAEQIVASEDEDQADGASATPNEDPQQVDAALDHLRGLSIWREEQATATEAVSSKSSIDTAEAPESNPTSEPVSFLDRYAHMFPAEDPAGTPTALVERPAPTQEVVPPPPEAHSEEESVEQYMAKLLARMRGGSTGSSVVSTGNETSAESPQQIPKPAVTERTVAPADEPMFTHLDELRAKVGAPEQPTDMAAMRALANQSARHAIGIHTARKLRRSAITRVIVTALGASVSVYLLLNASTWKSLQFAAGCAAGFAALYWGGLSVSTLLKGIQLGAFDEFEEEVTSDKSRKPPVAN